MPQVSGQILPQWFSDGMNAFFGGVVFPADKAVRSALSGEQAPESGDNSANSPVDTYEKKKPPIPTTDLDDYMDRYEKGDRTFWKLSRPELGEHPKEGSHTILNRNGRSSQHGYLPGGELNQVA